MKTKLPCALLLALASLFSISIPAALSRDLDKLDILGEKHPRVFFFRATEGAFSKRRYPTYEQWREQFDRLQGIMGKCLEEECLDREPRNPEFFGRFKHDLPNQAVLLHFNGNARDPRYHAQGKFFPGHWVYREAAMITQDIPAEQGETVIHVENAKDFRVNSGRYRTSNDDIALFGMTADGKHDWSYCEEVQLLSVDKAKKTITVRRGCYGTKPLAFKAGKSRAAAHQVEGPWGKTNHIMWFYNFATHCPKDSQGKNCTDRVVDDLAEWFGPGGVLAAFDGLEFDVLHHVTHGDTDGDGVEDDGVKDGINAYGIGVVRFAEQLRERMSDNFIIQADGALGPGGVRSQRAWGIMNGIESEGWPNLNDWEFDDWSGGLNRHYFWQANARKPVFNYVNHKWNEGIPGVPGGHKNPEVPSSRHRLVFAACQFFDAMICYSFAPRNDADGKYGIWDELRKGADGELGWLGSPEGPAVQLATQTPDLLQDAGEGSALAKKIYGDVNVKVTPRGLEIRPKSANADAVKFTIADIPTDGRDLSLAVVMRGEPMTGYPKTVARFAQVGVAGGMTDLLLAEPVEIGMKLRNKKKEEPLDRETGASCAKSRFEIAGVTRPCYRMHPPYRGATGYSYWTQDVRVPPRGELQFSLGMGELSPERSDGVQFEVHAAVINGDRVGPYRRLFSYTTNQYKWQPKSVSLASLANKQVRLKFVADCGPKNNATTDHAAWASIRIVPAGLPEDQITLAKKTMTWVNAQPFHSSFYYHHIQSPQVELSVEVEGGEPIVLQKVAAYAHPDATFRVFTGGLVLANPSRKPYTFDLQKLTPGRTYHRLQGTQHQDRQTNNGKQVGPTVTLGERDALFLVRDK